MDGMLPLDYPAPPTGTSTIWEASSSIERLVLSSTLTLSLAMMRIAAATSRWHCSSEE